MPAETGVLFSEWPLPPDASGASPAPLGSVPGDPSVPVAQPRFKVIDRRQAFFRCVDVEALIDEDHPARAIWNTVEKLDLSAFCVQMRAVEGLAGRSSMNPGLLVSLWVYAYSQGVGSAREISRLSGYHPAYQWLTGAETISDHTISSFRVEHKEALEKLFVEVVGVLSAEGFVKLKRVMQDGTKVRASAAPDSFRKRETLEQHLAEARQQCEALAKTDDSDQKEVQKQARKRAAEERVARLEAAVKQIEQLEENAGSDKTVRASSSDPEARNMKHADGGFAPSYNVQTTTAAEGKAVVSIEVTQAGNDFEQLQPALDRMQRTLSTKPEQAVVDGGYISQTNILETATSGVELIGPVMSTESKAAQCYQRAGVKPEFYADRFRFAAGENCMYCPMEKRLTYQGKTKSELVVIQKYQALARDCAACTSKVDCCPKNEKSGRSVQRSEYHQEIQDFQQRMAQPETKEIYHQRSEVAETPHLWMKAKFKLRQFHVRGLVKVGQEALWAALTYNIAILHRCRKQALSVTV
jgi:transposase